MDKSTTRDDAAEPTPKVASVSRSILSQFFDELAKDSAVGKVAPSLRKVVLEDGVFSEAAIRAVLFPDAQ